jgi:hypothetical protein
MVVSPFLLNHEDAGFEMPTPGISRKSPTLSGACQLHPLDSYSGLPLLLLTASRLAQG